MTPPSGEPPLSALAAPEAGPPTPAPVVRPERVESGEDVLRAIRQILRRVSEHSRYLAREVGLTLPQLLCLRVVGDAVDPADVTIARVAQRVQLSPATVSRIIDRLERAGLVRRRRGTSDRRKVFLELTPEGAKRHATLPVGLQERFLHRFSRLSATEREEMVRALRRVSAMMDAADIDAAPLLTAEPDVPTT